MGLRERLTASAAEIRARSQRLVELNVELLTTELKRKGQQYGTAIGLFVGAGVLALYALGFALTTIAVVLYIWLPLWLSLLIVTVVLALIVLILALVGRSTLRQAKTPSPERAIGEAKSTADALKTNLRKTADDLTPRRNGKVPAGLAAAPGDASIMQPLGARGGPSGPPPSAPLGGPPATPPSTPPSAPTPTPRDVPPSDTQEP
jgi:membrane protein implicated in regulation of membrane protease activity